MWFKWFEKNAGIAQLLARIVLAIIMIPAGWAKLSNLAGPTGFFESLGIPMAGVMAFIVGFVELVGGIMVLLGLFTRKAAILLGIIMIVALFTAHIGSWFTGFFSEKAFLALVLAVGLLFNGSGVLALEQMLPKKYKKCI